MNFIKKLLVLKNELGFLAVGLLFTVIGGAVVISGASDGSLMPLVFAAIGIVLVVAAALKIKNELTTPVKDKAQYDRVDKAAKNPAAHPADPNEPLEDFVYHFTGKMNQDQIMKDAQGNAVYEALCNGISLIKDTSYQFCDRLTGQQTQKMIGHTVTHSAGIGEGWSANISSSFGVDKTPVWDVLASMGYGFRFSLNGIAAHYEVERWGEHAGYVECAGTEVMNLKYKNNPLGKVPSKGIYRVRCRRSDIPGFFLICFALSRTEETVS